MWILSHYRETYCSLQRRREKKFVSSVIILSPKKTDPLNYTTKISKVFLTSLDNSSEKYQKFKY